jgi:Arm DNA-binding domain
MKKLTDAAVRAMAKPGLHADGDSLYLQISPALTKSWIFRKRHDGKHRKLGLGSYPAITPADARKAARKLLSDIDSGLDPFTAKAATKAAKADDKSNGRTLVECADA